MPLKHMAGLVVGPPTSLQINLGGFVSMPVVVMMVGLQSGACLTFDGYVHTGYDQIDCHKYDG
jgi:hypothetical protein